MADVAGCYAFRHSLYCVIRAYSKSMEMRGPEMSDLNGGSLISKTLRSCLRGGTNILGLSVLLTKK